jgi:hypothetical protein
MTKELTKQKEGELINEAINLIVARESAKESLAGNLTISKDTYGDAAANINKDAEAIYKATQDREKYEKNKEIKQREFDVVEEALS